MDKIKLFIDDSISKDSFYFSVEDREVRSKIHQYVKDKYPDHISRTEYMAHGAELKCCNVWYKSSNYGKSWNGGSIHCTACGEISGMDYDDCEDYMGEDIRFSLFRPTKSMMICKKGFPYKKKGKHPFSYRKKY